MVGEHIPGVHGVQPRRTPDAGTARATRSSVPGIAHEGAQGVDDLETAIAQLKIEATNFAYRFIADGNARQLYIRQAVATSEHYRAQVNAGILSPDAAAREVSRVRNEIMSTVRHVTSDVGRAYAEKLKSHGKSLAELEQRYAQRLFGRPFATLAPDQRNRAWMEIVEAAGRPQPHANSVAGTLGRIGRRLVFLSAAFAVYNVATAQDRPRQLAKEMGTTGAGIVGGAAAGAAAGLLCGPGAPACVAVGVFVGGAAAALGFEFVFDAYW